MTSNPIRELAAELTRQQRQIKALSKPRLAYSSIEDGALREYDRAGSLVQQIGQQHDGTHLAASLNGPIPPTPTAPAVTGTFGGATVAWDGFWADDAMTPMDFARVEIHTGHAPDFDASTAETLRTTFETERGGEKFIALPAGTHHVKLVAKTLAAKASPSTPVVAVDVEDVAALGGNAVTFDEDPPTTDGTKPGDVWFQVNGSGNVIGQFEWTGTAWEARQIEDDAIAGLAVGKLVAGTLAADAAIVVGDPDAANVRIDGAGEITAANADGEQTLLLDGQDNAIVGRLATGFSPDARVEVKPSGLGHMIEFFGEDQPGGEPRRAYVLGVNDSVPGYADVTAIQLTSQVDTDHSSNVIVTPVGASLDVTEGDSNPGQLQVGTWWSWFRSRRTRVQAHVVDPSTGALGGDGQAQIELKGNADPAGGSPSPGDYGAKDPVVDIEVTQYSSSARNRLRLNKTELLLTRYDGTGFVSDDVNQEQVLRVEMVSGFVELNGYAHIDGEIQVGENIRKMGSTGDWHEVGTAGAPAWATGWQTYAGAGYGPVRFKIDAQGMLVISGIAVRSAALAAGTTSLIFTLPLAYRPAQFQQRMVALSTGGYGRLLVQSDGTVYLIGGSTSLASSNYAVTDSILPLD